MAKKVKKKIDEDEEYKKFRFPDFDVPGFIEHELEQTSATFLSVLLAVAVSVLSWWLTARGGVTFAIVSLVIGAGVAAAFPFLVLRLREKATEYRKGDWATLLALYIFMWLGLWSLFLNL